MQLSKVTYALIAAGLIGGVATFYNQLNPSPVTDALAVSRASFRRTKKAITNRSFDSGIYRSKARPALCTVSLCARVGLVAFDESVPKFAKLTIPVPAHVVE